MINTGLTLNDLLLIDIETVPMVEEYSQLPEYWKTLWCDKISKTVPENSLPEEHFTSRAGILAEFGKIVCISLGYLFENENKEKCLKTKTIYNDDEAALLQEFISLTDKFYKLHKRIVFAGHNIREFDIPYLCRRMLIQNLPLPAYLQLHGAKPWEVNMIDTLQWWKFGDYKNFISLHLLASVLNIPTSKDDIDGSMVQHVYYKDKNLPRIAQYCQKDIIVVANILLRFQNLPLLQKENIFIAE